MSVAAFFYFIAIIGYSKNACLIAYGIMLHGAWDLFRDHALVVQTNIPHYWPSYCLITDVIGGVYFLLYFKMRISV